jgi:hypothetical protein
LTHAIQQREAFGPVGARSLKIGPASGPAEREAETNANAIAAGAAAKISATSTVGLQREAISNNERFLDLEPCNELACIDSNACVNDASGVTCPDGTRNAFSKTKHKFSRHVRCDTECKDGIVPCLDTDLELALPTERFTSTSKCDEELTLCANGKSATAKVRERSNKNSWEATRSVAAALGVSPDFHASIYPEANDPDMKGDPKCVPKKPKAPAKGDAPAPHKVSKKAARHED